MKPPDPIDREQMPGSLARFDDPWGISWRVANAVRRFSVRWLGRFLWGYGRGVRYRRPIFVLGVPRSGTTLLFHLLRESRQLGSLPGEGHNVWRLYHHPRSHGWRGDAVGHGELRFGERRLVNACFYAHVGRRRLVEKTPENSLRIPYLLELFPDARFVVIHRHPCDVIHSLINGWRHPEGRFRSYYVPEDLSIPDYPHRRRWCFVLIAGWRQVRHAPIAEIAFAQWEQCVRGLESGRALVRPERWSEIRLEQLLADPGATTARLYRRLGIDDEPALRTKLEDLIAHPVNALSRPGKEKWRDNRREIEPLLPRIAARARPLGYVIDPETGDFEMR